MICDRCHERSATVFCTKILDGQMEKEQYCDECYAIIDAAHIKAVANGCRYCGMPPLAASPFGETVVLCARCMDEAFRFLDTLSPPAHMKKWLSLPRSQGG